MSSVKADGSNIQRPNKDYFFEKLMLSIQKDITNVLPEHLSFRRFARMTVMALYNNPSLRECSPQSIIMAVGEAAQMGLVPDGRQACIVPYRQKGNPRASFQTMYQGELQLAYNTGMYQFVTAEAVHENDEFHFKRGFPNHELVHVPSLQKRGKLIGFWAGYRLANGGYDFVYDSFENLMEHGKRYSRSFEKSDSPWQTNPEEMCRKTILLKALRLAPKSSEYREPGPEVTDVTDIAPESQGGWKQLQPPEGMEEDQALVEPEPEETDGDDESGSVDIDNPELDRAWDGA